MWILFDFQNKISLVFSAEFVFVSSTVNLSVLEFTVFIEWHTFFIFLQLKTGLSSICVKINGLRRKGVLRRQFFLKYDQSMGFWMIPKIWNSVTLQLMFFHIFPLSHPRACPKIHALLLNVLLAHTNVSAVQSVLRVIYWNLLKNYYHFSETVVTLWYKHTTQHFVCT